METDEESMPMFGLDWTSLLARSLFMSIRGAAAEVLNMRALFVFLCDSMSCATQSIDARDILMALR
jgi:hypothetical protein